MKKSEHVSIPLPILVWLRLCKRVGGAKKANFFFKKYVANIKTMPTSRFPSPLGTNLFARPHPGTRKRSNPSFTTADLDQLLDRINTSSSRSPGKSNSSNEARWSSSSQLQMTSISSGHGAPSYTTKFSSTTQTPKTLNENFALSHAKGPEIEYEYSAGRKISNPDSRKQRTARQGSTLFDTRTKRKGKATSR